MGMRIRHRPNAGPDANDEFYKKAEKAFKEKQAKESAESTTEKAKPQVKGRRRKSE